MNPSNDSQYILLKVLKEHKEKETEFYSTLSKFLEVGGWEAMASAITPGKLPKPTGIITYPDVKMPNGTLTQTITTTGSSSSVFVGEFKLSSPSNVMYDFTISIDPPNSSSSSLIFAVTSNPGGSSSGYPTMENATGYTISCKAVSDTVVVDKVNVYLNGVIQFTSSPNTTITGMRFRENITKRVDVNYIPSNGYITAFPDDSYDRYFQIYRNDGGVSGLSWIVQQIA